MSALVKPEVVIKDACILFDLIELGLLESFYKLNLIVVTTPEVLSEITDEVQLVEINKYIDNGSLEIDNWRVFEILRGIVDNNPGLSFTDASVLETASRRGATILSSDKSLRNESQRRGLKVRGMLWIFEQLYVQSIVSLEIMLEKLKQYPEINKRTPKVDIQNLINRYSS